VSMLVPLTARAWAPAGILQRPSTLPPGDGPRHFHFHPNGRWPYSLQEESSTVVRFDYDAARGRLTPRQTLSTLPPGFAGSSFGSEILVSADGRFVYAGNRLHDSIGIFGVGRDGDLKYLGEEWTRGSYPRSFAFDPGSQLPVSRATTTSSRSSSRSRIPTTPGSSHKVGRMTTT